MFKNKKKILYEIQEEWGNSIYKERDFGLISTYHNLVKKNLSNFVNETTWSDLNMNELFSIMDRTATPIGSQYLFHILHKYDSPGKLKGRSQRIQNFIQNQNLRENILLILKKLDRKKSFYIANLLYSKLPDRPNFYYVFYFLSALAIILIPMAFIYPQMILYSFFVITVNLIVEHIFGKKADFYISDLSLLSTMLRNGVQLAKLESDLEQIVLLKAKRHISEGLLKKIGWLTIDKNRLDDLSAMLVEYLNHFFLFNLVAFVRSIHFLNQYQTGLRDIFQSMASLDAEIAVSSYLYENENYCIPSFNQSNIIEFTDVYHPLLENPVSNTILLKDNSCLITGSNMAGKTTFIKTIGINVILAQSLFFSHAQKAEIPHLYVYSTIKRSDDIAEHKSYYFKEIEAILDFIQLEKKSTKFLFLIDEIFRGTNTIERISAATSVLKYLAKNNFIMVTTHDIELQDTLKENFKMFHFSEQVTNGNFYFDYRLKKGPCSSRNAIKLLELKGYPKTITEEAISISKTISNRIDSKSKNQ